MRFADLKMRLVCPLWTALLLLLPFLLCAFAAGKTASGETAGADTTAEGRNGWIFFPYLFYTPETRVGFGGGGGYFFREPRSCGDSRPSTILGNIIYTQNKQLVLAVQPDIYWRDERYYLRSELSYQKFPDRFYGIGNRTSSDLEEDFTPEEVRVLLRFQIRLLPGLLAGPLYEYFNGTLDQRRGAFPALIRAGRLPADAGILRGALSRS
jgi:hypothetical protein